MNETDKKAALESYRAYMQEHIGTQKGLNYDPPQVGDAWLRSWQLATQAAYARAAQECYREHERRLKSPSRADGFDCARAILDLNGEPEAPAPVTAEGWTSVNDRLPEFNLLCLVFSPKENGDYRITIAYRANDGRGQWWEHAHEAVPVTHWMPLPAAPKVEG